MPRLKSFSLWGYCPKGIEVERVVVMKLYLVPILLGLIKALSSDRFLMLLKLPRY